MGAPYDNIPGVDSGDNFHPDIRAALLASTEFNSLTGRLGSAAKLVTDWNLAVANGFYAGDASAANSPVASTWFLGHVEVLDATYLTQTVHAVTSDSSADTMVYRRAYNSSSWTAWYRVRMSEAELDARYQAAIASGTTAQYYRGDKTWQTLNSTAVGLGNVNNTTDANKPVSTAQQAAIDLGAKGLVAFGEQFSNSGAIGAQAIVLNIPSFTFKANRRYRVVVSGNYYSSGNTSTGTFVISTCPTADAASSTSNLTTIKATADRPNMASEGRQIYISREGLKFGSDTTLQIKYSIQRISGSDGFFSQASASDPLALAVYDDGINV